MSPMPDSSIQHACPGGCGARVPDRLFACRGCWARLPAELKRPIRANYGRDRAAHAAAMSEARRWYAEQAAVTR